jgi:hypothetical protein
MATLLETKKLLLRRLLLEIQCPRYSQNTEDALRNMYQELVAAHGAMLDLEGKELVRYLIHQEGAIDTILQVIRCQRDTTPSPPQLIPGAFGVLTLFAQEEPSPPQLIPSAFGILTLFAQEEPTLVAEKGGFDAILDGMQRCQVSSEHVQQTGIVALVELSRRTRSFFQTNPRAIVGAVVHAMEHYKYSPKLYYLACNAMRIACEFGVILEDDMALRVHGNLMDGILLFPGDMQAQQSGRQVLGLWVGWDRAIHMIEHRAEALCTLERILREVIMMRRDHDRLNRDDQPKRMRRDPRPPNPWA